MGLTTHKRLRVKYAALSFPRVLTEWRISKGAKSVPRCLVRRSSVSVRCASEPQIPKAAFLFQGKFPFLPPSAFVALRRRILLECLILRLHEKEAKGMPSPRAICL